MTTLTDALRALEVATDAYAYARAMEDRVEHERPIAKHAAMLRILQTTNVLTGKPHSASSAEAAVEQDETYAAYLAAKRECTTVRILAETSRDIARIRATALSLGNDT